MRRALEGPGVPGPDAETLDMAWVGPWQYQCGRTGGYWVGGRGSTHPVYPPRESTRYAPTLVPTQPHHPGTTVRVHGTVSSAPSKEILGVDNTHLDMGIARSRTPHLTPAAPRDPSRLPGAGCEAGPGSSCT